jgi:hypothetical protein
MGLRGRLPPPPPPGPPPPFQQGGGGSHDLLAWLVVFLVIVLVGVVVYFAVGYASRPHPEAPFTAASGQDLLALVALRYANGDITREEFLRLQADLGGPPIPEAKPPPSGETSNVSDS